MYINFHIYRPLHMFQRAGRHLQGLIDEPPEDDDPLVQTYTKFNIYFY
jgi:hypothetical protein